MAMRFDLIIFEKFTYKGQPRNKAHKVGTAMNVRDGYMLFIAPGVPVSGRVMMVPEKTRLERTARKPSPWAFNPATVLDAQFAI